MMDRRLLPIAAADLWRLVQKKAPEIGGKERVSSCSRVLLTEHELENA